METIDEVLQTVSVIVPVNQGDIAWRELAQDLGNFPLGAEFIFVATDPLNTYDQRLIDHLRKKFRVRWVLSPRGLARQLNRGAALATGRFLWFVHCDTRFTMQSLGALAHSLRTVPDAIHYFRLRFLSDGPALTAINAIGIRLQSQIGRLPVGQQAICIPRYLFEKIGAFNTEKLGNSDVDFIVRAQRLGVGLKQINASIHTSSRRFAKRGWLKTTVQNLKNRFAQI